MNTLLTILIILVAVAGAALLMLLWYGMTEARKNSDHRRQMERAGLPYTAPQRRGAPKEQPPVFEER